MELLSDQGLRVDGRRPNELRKIICKIGVDDDCGGSAYYEQGNTKVLARVYGPQEPSSLFRSKAGDSAFVNVNFVNTTHGSDERMSWTSSDRKTTEIRLNLQQILSSTIQLERFPRSQIDVCVELLEEDGGNFGACMNAITLALIDAGIPITEYMVGCNASLVKNDVPMVDINNLEEAMGGPCLNVVVYPLTKQIAHMEMSQRFHIDFFEKVLQVAEEGCRDIYAIMDRAIKLHLYKISGVTPMMET